MKIPVQSEKSQKAIKRIFLIGILIRVLVMPWFAHGDIIAVHKRVESIVCGSKTLADFDAVGTHLIESIFATIFKPIVPCSILSGIQNSFYDAPKLNRMVFFFKLPYLIFEIGFWYLMWKVINPKKEKTKKKLAVFLGLNPIAIYSIYMFGRFESYNLFLSALILLVLKNINHFSPNEKAKNSSDNSFNRLLSKILPRDSMGIPLKNSLIISLIFFILLTVRKSYLLIFPALLPAVGSLTSIGLMTLIGIGGFGLLAVLSGRGLSSLINFIKSGHHAQYFFNASFNTGENRLVYLFFLGLGLIFLWGLKNWTSLKEKSPIYRFSLFSFLTLSVFYATSVFHPQYLTWILPFMAILIFNRNNRFLYQSFWFFIPAFFLYLLSWGNFTTFGLLFPVSTAFKQIEPGWYLPVYGAQTWGNIGRSFISTFGIYWTYYLTHNSDD